MTDKSSVDGDKKIETRQLRDADFELLMEFQRQVIKKYGSGRVPWFLSAIGDLARLKGVATNEALTAALEDFDRFLKEVKKKSGSIPAEDDPGNDAETDLLDDINDDIGHRK